MCVKNDEQQQNISSEKKNTHTSLEQFSSRESEAFVLYVIKVHLVMFVASFTGLGCIEWITSFILHGRETRDT